MISLENIPLSSQLSPDLKKFGTPAKQSLVCEGMKHSLRVSRVVDPAALGHPALLITSHSPSQPGCEAKACEYSVLWLLFPTLGQKS